MSHLFDFSHFPVIYTERLQLREMTIDDVDAILKHFANPAVSRYIDNQPFKTLEDANDWLQWMGSFFSAKDGLRWGITLKDSNQFIGSAGIHGWNREINYAEIGYDISQDFWGRGFATEVANAIIHFGFERMKLNRIEADVIEGNEGSVRVLQKLNFQHEGILRERIYKNQTYHDLHLFSLLCTDYNLME